MVEPIKVKVQPISVEAFKRYGQMLNKHPVFPEVEPGEGRVAIEIKYPTPRPETKQMPHLAIHFSYNQTYIPLGGPMVTVVAPAPRNREADEADYEFDFDKLAAFLLKPGQVMIIDKGVWHHSFWIGPQTAYVNVTRKNPGEGTSLDAGDRVDLIPTRRKYIGFVDLPKRFNRIIEIGDYKHLLES